MAGMMIWELGQDHFDASGNQTAFSLLPAIKSVVATRTPAARVSPTKIKSSLFADDAVQMKKGRTAALLETPVRQS